MSERGTNLPPEQQAIRDKCFHPSGTFVEFPIEDVEVSIPARFEKIVRMYPDRLAVKDIERSLTYDELNKAANQIAHSILEKRGQVSEPVILFFEHAIDVIATILGVLKAGKFYVVIDPSSPLERTRSIVEDCGADIIVTNSRNADLANKLEHGTCALVNIDRISDFYPSDDIGHTVLPDDLATICYTSGSTGKPKGVVQAHRNVLHSVKILSERYGVTVNDRLTLLHSLSFASGHAHFRISLLNGASLFPFNITSEGVRHLANWLEEEQLTIYHSPPALFRQLAGSLSGREKFENLRLIHLSGAPITQLDLDLYKKGFGPETLLEFGMGSTEAREIGSAIVDRTFSFPEGGAPVGYPPLGKKILLLDENGHEVELGQIGEIAVKGRNLNPGYWNQPDLTEARFLPDPNGGGERIFLTGDLGRMLPDGFLIHMGRKDFMVKIRGYRVELGEIESALLLHPLIKDAGVVAWEREAGEKYLVAYVVPRNEPAPRIDALRAFLSDSLPDFMIPSAFVFLESLPLTNGKLDRTALPKPEGNRPEIVQPYVAPRSKVEQDLVRIWEEVLDVRPVGIHDNFFDLGGHSLAATRALSRIVGTFDVSLRLTQLFQTPTVAAIAEKIDEPVSIPNIHSRFEPIKKREEIESSPISLTQQRLWFLHQLEPESCAYNLLSATRLTGPLDVTALKQSLGKVIERHEVLRTIFVDHDGKPRQVILPSVAIDLTAVDMRQSAHGNSLDAKVSALAVEFGQIPFDLARGPLLRVKLLRLSEDQFVLLNVVHHIVYDAWSIGIFARDLSNFYNAIVKSETLHVQPLPIQYGDFATWQQERFLTSKFTADLEYWKRQLVDLTILQMPTDRPRPAVQTHRGGKKSFVLNEALTAAIKKLGRNENATLFMTLLAAFQTLLHRYTSQDDIAIGTAVDGRPQRETEDVIGFFLNTLVLRTQFTGDPSFRKLLARVREVCLGGFDHRNLPFDKLVEALHPGRNLSYNPLFSVGFAFQNTPEFPWQLSGVAAQKWELDSGNAQFDLHVFLEEEGQTLKGSAIFNADLFDTETISRLLDHFTVLLEGIVVDPEKRVSELPLLTQAEQRQLLLEWNDTERKYPNGKCLHELFEEQVEKTPDAVALVFEDKQVTYRELSDRSNQLAHYLQKRGVGPGVLVGICLERSIEMIIGLLGILKAGGAYVPLDPSYPQERLTFMLEDCRVRALLTEEKFLSGIECATSICLDRDWQEIVKENITSPKIRHTPEDLAYVMYTSGSTGKPKGTLISNRNVTRLFHATEEWFQFDSSDVWTLFHSYAFDFSVWEIWGALLYGGKLVVVTDEIRRSPQEFTELLIEHRVTVLNQTPAAFRQLMPHLTDSKNHDRLDLRFVIFGGEALELRSLKPWFECYGDENPKLINMYGITETTVHVTYRPIKRADIEFRAGSVIGEPIPDLTVYVLDSHQQLQPVGIPGEICVGGAGVARGYLQRPELTAERFIADPFSGDLKARLYRSGDLARWLPNGELEYLGRIDDQVKIRGYRIELGEIEAVLNQYSKVPDAVVIVREDCPDDKRLVAYVVATEKEELQANELRQFLKTKLPDYMVPSAFVCLDSLPLTPNGKVDRRALPAPDECGLEAPEEFTAPRTQVEKTLAKIWAEMLKREKVGIHDNFFDLGGHSLLATQVISRLRNVLNLEIPLRTLFESPTIEQMAAVIMQHQGKRLRQEELERMLGEWESLSDEEAQRLLAEDAMSKSGGARHE